MITLFAGIPTPCTDTACVIKAGLQRWIIKNKLLKINKVLLIV